MELSIKDNTKSSISMRFCNQIMFEVFQDSIELKEYFGPVQMGVFNLEYKYLTNDYKIIIDSGRGFITLTVKNKNGGIFSPWMIYPESRYFHFADVKENVYQLIELTFNAINESKIVFLSTTEINNLGETIKWAD